MKTLVVCALQQRERRIVVKFTIGLIAAALLWLAGLVACNDKDKDDQQSNASKAVAGQQTAAQKPSGKPDADEGEEGEEGPATPAAVAPKNLLLNRPRASSPSTTLTTMHLDSCPRNFMVQKPGEVLKR